MTETINDGGGISWMRRLIADWISEENWSLAQLINWLQGYDLPPIGHEEEPYIWILRGLPLADKRYAVETAMARRIAILIDAELDRISQGERPSQVIYNMLMLCTGLSSPDHLAEPLWNMYRRSCLDGDWIGFSLRRALRNALSENQVDSRLASTWLLMIDRETDFLPGNEFDGFQGLLLMPDPEFGRGAPALEMLGVALGKLATWLEEEDGRRLEFIGLLRQLYEVYPGRPTWDQDLVLLADHNNWPTWSVRCLNNLFLEKPNRPHNFFVWKTYIQLLSEHEHQQIRCLCQGEVVLCLLSQEAEEFLWRIIPRLEHCRRTNPKDSETSSIADIVHELSLIEQEALFDGSVSFAGKVELGRFLLLRNQRILPEVPEVLEEMAK